MKILLILSFFTQMSNYCSTPPFVANAVTPNVLIILDNSGSMLWAAYDNDENASNIASGYDPNYKYFGYFDPTKKYSYSHMHGGYFYEDPYGSWSGNYLNWVSMTRIDVAREALTGGKYVVKGTDTLIVFNKEARGSNNMKVVYQAYKYTPFPFNKLYSRRTYQGNRPVVSFYRYSPYWGRVGTYTLAVLNNGKGKPEGFVQQTIGKVRYGLMFFNYSQGGYIADYIHDADDFYNGDYHYNHLISDINRDLGDYCSNCTRTTWTPLGEALYEAYRYLSQLSPYYHSYDFHRSPGNPNYDPYYIYTRGPSQPLPVPCRHSSVIIVTDGEPTQDRDIPVDIRDYDHDGNDPIPKGENPHSYPWNQGGSDYLDDIALYMHTNDIRSDLEGMQNVDIYAIRAFGKASVKTLSDAAKNGAFVDQNGNNYPDLQSEWDANGDGIPDGYFEAPSGYLIQEALLKILSFVLERISSGTSVSVLSSSVTGEGTALEAFFVPAMHQGLRKLTWLGYLQALWVDAWGNFREDSNHDLKLELTQDTIVRFKFEKNQTEVLKYPDKDGDGVPDTFYPVSTTDLNHVNALWRAHELLAKEDFTNRRVFTAIDGISGESLIKFNSINADELRSYLNVASTSEAENVIDYVLGKDLEYIGYRDRTVDLGTGQYEWKLGDIVYSSPMFVGSPAERYDIIYKDKTYSEFFQQYRDRRRMVYVGANDGMLHAFNAGKYERGTGTWTISINGDGYKPGEEMWGFIPRNVLPHLKWLTNPDYCHVYYVDLTPKVTDARIFNNDDTHPNGWGTVLIEGLRFGGGKILAGGKTFSSSYFALDITDPDKTRPTFLWEFRDDDLGYTTVFPSIVRRGRSDRKGKWYVVTGSGPNQLDGESTQSAHIYVLKLKNGKLKRKIALPYSSSFCGNPVSVDEDLNFKTDYVYIGVNRKSGGRYLGSLWRIDTKGRPSNWELKDIFDAQGPIVTQPAVFMDEKDNLWVFVGTGKYFSDKDEADKSYNYLYAFKDPGNGTVSVSDLIDVTNAVVYQASNGMVYVDYNNRTYTFDDFVRLVQQYKGWMRKLTTPGERVVARPVIYGGAIFVSTFTPDRNICSFGGTSKLYGLFYLTGTPYKLSIFGKRGYTQVGNKKVFKSSISLGKGIASAEHFFESPKQKGKGFIQTSTGEVVEVNEVLPLKVKSGVMLWREKD